MKVTADDLSMSYTVRVEATVDVAGVVHGRRGEVQESAGRRQAKGYGRNIE